MTQNKSNKSLAAQILNDLFELSNTTIPLVAPYSYLKRLPHIGPGDISHAFWNLKNSGAVTVFEKNNQKFIKLTKKGQLRILIEKAGVQKQLKWDGKWRLLIFDIPEGSRKNRDLLRRLLKENSFLKLQASVFISPYQLNAEAVDYLKETGLMSFIRILRVDKVDDDKDLRKKFGLKSLK